MFQFFISSSEDHFLLLCPLFWHCSLLTLKTAHISTCNCFLKTEFNSWIHLFFQWRRLMMLALIKSWQGLVSEPSFLEVKTRSSQQPKHFSKTLETSCSYMPDLLPLTSIANRRIHYDICFYIRHICPVLTIWL